jgi:hypothetical protein
MSVWIVRCTPVAALRDGHVHEASRAFSRTPKSQMASAARVEHGLAPHALDDDTITDVLWIARALPAAIDTLSDARAELDLGETRLSRFRVERRRRDVEAPVVALSIYARGADSVEVRFLPQRLLDEGLAREECPVIVRMHVQAPLRGQIHSAFEDSNDRDEPSPIVVRRFTHGRNDGRR